MLTTLVIGIIAVVVAVVLLSSLSPLRWIPNDRVGVIEKRFSPTKGSIKSGFMALGGEAGYQPSVLRGGIHILNPFQYRVHTVSLVTIPQGKIGYVFARDGQDLPAGQTLASNAKVGDFRDVRAPRAPAACTTRESRTSC